MLICKLKEKNTVYYKNWMQKSEKRKKNLVTIKFLEIDNVFTNLAEFIRKVLHIKKIDQ